MTKYTVTPTISKSVSVVEGSYQAATTNTTHEHLKQVDQLPIKKASICTRIVNVICSLRLEIVSFLITFSFVLPRITSTTLILDKVCLAHFNYPKRICDNLANYTDLKPPIERLATNYQLGHTLIQTAPAAFLSCFIGPWSDKYGRKAPVYVAMFGLILDNIGASICAYFLNSRVEYYLIPAFFTGFSGGVVTLLTVVYSYASDLTIHSQRTMKYAFIEMATGLAIPFGVALGGWIFNFLGHPPVFLCTAGGLISGLLGVLYLLPETRGLNVKASWKRKFKDLFSCETFKESFIATLKKRPNKGRKQIILLILSICFIIISTNSTTDINFLYVHHQFNWGNTEYSSITAIYSMFAIVLLVIIVPIFKRIRVSDAKLGLLGTTSLLIKFIGIGLSYKESIFHLANLLGLLTACAPLAVRSRISKVVSNDDIGKVFSFVATAESLLPVLTTVLISQIFNAFLTIFPGMPYIFLAIFLIIPFSVFTWLTCLPNLTYEDLQGNSEKSRETYVKIDP